MRIVVIGTSGSGKTTFANKLGTLCDIAAIDLDLINWRPNWFDRYRNEKDEFIADVQKAIAGENWVIAGAYSGVRDLIWNRATHIVWLDLPKLTIMRQVILRSLKRAIDGKDVFPGCREDWQRLFRSDHPIRIAWDTYSKRRVRFEAMLKERQFQHLNVIHCSNHKEIFAAINKLSQQNLATPIEN